MNVSCPACSTVYRLDPARIPEAGATTRCRRCGDPFHIDAADPGPPGEVRTGIRVHVGADTPPPTAEPHPQGGPGSTPALDARPEPAEEPAADRPERPVFGPQDPDTRARRLARALVSDIKVYNPDRWEESLAAGTLRKAFRDEVLKSWDEYVEQVGERMAKTTPYFRDALNDILAAGRRVF